MNSNDLHELVKQNEENICQIAAYKGERLVYSDTWSDYKEDDCCHVMSVTKSIVSLLIGIAIDQGLIEDENQYVLDFFPDYKVKRGEKTIQKVQIKHLLMMQAPYKYVFEPWSKVCRTDDWTVAALDLLGGKKGITGEFRYATLGVHILTGILKKVSGLSTVEFADKYLFAPLGIASHENFLAKDEKEHKEFTLSKEPRKPCWFVDPQNVGTAGYGLCISALDMAKIGKLCLDGGIYKDKRIVSAKWIEKLKTPTYKCGKDFANMSYGYLWWILDESAYAAIGDGGNVIYINEKEKIIITVAATFKPRVFDRIDFIKQNIEPFVLQQ